MMYLMQNCCIVEYIWTIEKHFRAPESIKAAITTMVLLRSLEHSSIVSLMPNELLFEIFQFL